MDYFKQGTAKNWSVWGLDVKEVGILYTRKKYRALCKQFKRSARRKDKQAVRGELILTLFFLPAPRSCGPRRKFHYIILLRFCQDGILYKFKSVWIP